jgi:hypothetical protein
MVSYVCRVGSVLINLFSSRSRLFFGHFVQTLPLHQPRKAFTHPGHEIIRSSTSLTNSQLAVASFRQQTAVGTNIDERVSSHNIDE